MAKGSSAKTAAIPKSRPVVGSVSVGKEYRKSVKRPLIAYLDQADENDLEYLATLRRRSKSALVRELIHEAAKLERQKGEVV